MRKRENHGQSKTRVYAIWSTMIARCHNPRSVGYPHYGGRGVTVCDRWRGSFVAFMEDMGSQPTPRSEIDRVDGAKGYGPENCRWATALEQGRNRETVHRVTFNGETLTLSEWAERIGVKPRLLYKRIVLLGWTPERAMTMLDHADQHYVEFGGERLHIAEWARRVGAKEHTLAYRLRAGWTVERALTTPVR